MSRIDAHQHFWQLNRGDYHWLTQDLEVLYRDFLPEDLTELSARYGVTMGVLVQAAPTVAETQFLLELAQNHEGIVAVIGWVDFESVDAVSQLRYLANNQFFKGVRPMLQGIEQVDWILNPDFDPVFRALIDLDLSFDALITSAHLPVMLELLRRYPTLRVVVDHGAKPNIAQREYGAWFDGLRSLAEFPTVYCKLSGLQTEAAINDGYPELVPYMDALLKLFGCERLMWGSDWPVINLATDYHQWLSISEKWISQLGADQQHAIWQATAAQFYRI